MSDPVHPWLLRNLRIAYRWVETCRWQLTAHILHRRGDRIPVSLPYDATNPVVYAKDWTRNCYTDDFVMALASAGRIDLRGFVTASTTAPYNHWVSAQDFERWVEQRARSVAIARLSGLRNIPDPVRGPSRHLARPASGQIEDTSPIASEGTRLVIEEAMRASPQRPLLVVACTGLTLAADAYLVEPRVADRMIVLWLGGHESDMACYGGWSDGWAAYIVLQRLRMVQFPPFRCDPRVPRAQIEIRLPDCPFRDWMTSKALPVDQGGARDTDAPPVVSIVRKDFVLKTRPVSFGRWISKERHLVPAFRDDPQGQALVVVLADRNVATAAWWSALTDPLAYAGLQDDRCPAPSQGPELHLVEW